MKRDEYREVVRSLIRDGRSEEAEKLVDAALAESRDTPTVAHAILAKIGCLINLGRYGECPAVIDRAFEIMRRYPEPAYIGELHAHTAYVAFLEGSLDRCVTHLVRSSRALASTGRPGPDAADAWADLALTYSGIGFHGHALGALDRGRRIAAAAGLPAAEYVVPEIRVRLAVSLDHRGDSDGCVRILHDVLAQLPVDATPQTCHDLPEMDRPYIGYALARLGACGRPMPTPAYPWLSGRRSHDPLAADLRALGGVCLDIAEQRPEQALERLAQITVEPRVLGASEVPRLRALAYAANGEHVAASEADREAFRLTAQAIDRLRDLFIDGVEARLDHDDLRRTVARYADEALTDPLTGLPNRRRLEQHVETMSRRGERGVIGVLDLDAFSAVNNVHGHRCGDLVLQRAAALLARVMRRGDFVARYGGDEFVVVLPTAQLPEAYEIANRIRTAFATEDWESLVPGSSMTVSIGWAELDLRSGVMTGFEAADRAMYAAKHAARAS
ncbi:MAG: GGDEF domain-containing protein [Actinocatenispora sp.]